MKDTKDKNTKQSRAYNIKKLLSEVRLGMKPNTGMVSNKVNDPRGNHEGGPGSWRDNLDDKEYRKNWKRRNFEPRDGYDDLNYGKSLADYYKNSDVKGNVKGKNIPTIWQIQSEPHNFSKELGVDVEHFAVFPEALLEIPTKFGCPKWVCKKCGKARERMTKTEYTKKIKETKLKEEQITDGSAKARTPFINRQQVAGAIYNTIGWTDCGCNAGWKPGIVLDPFMGSGTTAIVAKKLGRDFIGIELSKDYIKIAEQRLKKVKYQPDLWGT